MRTRLLFPIAATLAFSATLALAVTAAALGVVPAAPALDPAAALVPRGHYVEARTAAVFAGACHYGAQQTTQGREAVVAWRFDGGEADGVSLAGVAVVCAVASGANLTEDAARRSIVYVSSDASPAQQGAAVALVRERYAALLGDVLSVRPAAIVHRADERGHTVAIPEVLTLAGQRIPDRCCKMELQVWYAPFGKRIGALAQLGEDLGGGDVRAVEVSNHAVFRLAEPALAPAFERLDENNGFVGSFAFADTRAGRGPSQP